MSQVLDEVLAANESYAAAFGSKAKLGLPPQRQFAILTWFTNEIIGGLLTNSLETASFSGGEWRDRGAGPGSDAGKSIDWLTIGDQAESVRQDVARIQNHPLVPAAIPVYGYVYDVANGRLISVTEKAARA